MPTVTRDAATIVPTRRHRGRCRIGREARVRGRGRVAAIGWQQAEKAARRAKQDGGGLRGLRDCAIILLMSDSLARISEVAALEVAAVEEDAAGGGTLTIRASRPISSAPDTLVTSGRPCCTRCVATWQRPATTPARCSARCGAAATAAPRRSDR